MKFLMDADCLIKLTKAGLKELVGRHDTVVIPSAVEKEVVDAGKAKGCTDAFIVEKNVARKYQEGQMTLRDAAGLLNMPLSETLDLLCLLGVKGNIRAGDVLASLDSFAPLD